MITHYETVQFAALTILGMLSLTVALLAMLYSTAAVALVAPQLKFGDWHPKLMYGLVKTSFANPIYLADTCMTPIQKSTWDPDYSPNAVGQNCLQLDHVAQGSSNITTRSKLLVFTFSRVSQLPAIHDILDRADTDRQCQYCGSALEAAGFWIVQ
jgi:hypothetical protein